MTDGPSEWLKYVLERLLTSYFSYCIYNSSGEIDELSWGDYQYMVVCITKYSHEVC